jgi:predicted outer membrane lipoprotein
MPEKSDSKHQALLSCAFAVLLAFVYAATATHARSQQDTANGRDASNAEARADVAALMRKLTDRDALTRQRAAEDIARVASPAQRKLVEGYRLQEKNARVRLALDWALYRMGKTPALFAVVRDLDSNRWNQSEAYLAELETPEPLHGLLPQVNGNTQIKLLEALARSGTADTLPVVEPYAASIDPKIADAARFATREITRRLNAPPLPDARKRTRQVGKTAVDVP